MSQIAAANPPTDGLSATMTAVAVTGLEHTYPARRRRRRDAVAQPPPTTRPALRDVCLTIDTGEIFAILGPNGGGKTTLFRVLTTMLLPTGGQASVFGRSVLRDSDAVRRMIGVVFQHPSLDGKLTVGENLHHHGRMYGLEADHLATLIPHWLGRFGIADRLDDLAEKLSGGQQRRVELAKAMLTQPRLLLMDEPSTGLDPGARRDLWQTLLQLRDSHGITIALTTHLMDEADRCDRLAILAHGQLVAVGTPDELKARIGGQVIVVEPDPAHDDNEPADLAAMITERFGPWEDDASPRVVDGKVRFEKRHGAAIINSLLAACPGRIRAVSVGQPTLEDVFLHLTGHRFHDRTDL